jgi:hypothetical protein
MNFGSLNYFLLFKTNGKAFKSRPQYWAGNWLGATVQGLAAQSYRGGVPRGGSGACAGRTRGVVTTRWPHTRRWGGVAGPRAPTDKLSRERWREHRWGCGNAPEEVAAVMAHPSSGSTCGDVQRWRTHSGDGRRRWRGPAVLEEKGDGEAHAN